VQLRELLARPGLVQLGLPEQLLGDEPSAKSFRYLSRLARYVESDSSHPHLAREAESVPGA